MAKQSNQKAEITKVNDIQLKKISVFFKRSILKSILKILLMEHSGFRTIKSVKNINRLFNNIDEKLYENNVELKSYIWCILFFSKKWLDGIVNVEILTEGCKLEKEYDNVKENIINNCINDKTIVTPPEAKMIFDLISEALQYGFLSSIKNEYLSMLDDISLDHPGAFRELADRLFNISHSLIDIKHNTNFLVNKVTFNTADIESVKNAIDQTISSLSTSGNIFKTGIRRLNTLLSPGYMNGKLYMYLGLPKKGKMGPNDALIPTPEGIKRFDQIDIGDRVFNKDGRSVFVTHIFPQGVQDCYEVELTDSRIARCGKDHLWYTLIRDKRNPGRMKGHVRTLESMLYDFKKITSDGRERHKYVIPNNGPAQFDPRPTPLDPYTMGYIIGNGCCRSPRFEISTNDEIVIKRISNAIGALSYHKNNSNYSWYFKSKSSDTIWIKTRDIIGNIPEVYMKYSHEKKIPDCYLYNTIEVRMELMRGLMDSDGNISAFKQPTYMQYRSSYSTSSELLRDDFVFLCRSLGYQVSIRPDIREDRRTNYNIAFNVSNQTHMNLFWLPRKMDIAMEAFIHKNAHRDYDQIRIKDIRKIEPCSQRCIVVDDPLHVYLTEQFIPTHNSTVLLKSVLDIRRYNPNFTPKTPGMKPCVLYVTMENSFTETVERLWGMTFDDSITNYSIEEAIDKLSEELGIGINNNSDQVVMNTENECNIEIVIKYFSYREICTDDLFTVIQDLRDDGLEVCVLVFDYIKRIRPNIPDNGNERVELDRICNELKSMAVVLDIPVISAHQINRSGASISDNFVRQGKGDEVKLIGREHIADCWGILQVVDWACVVGMTYKPGTHDKYMAFNLLDRRRVDASDAELSGYEYLVHPFAKNNGLRLLDDINLSSILSLQSLVNDLDGIVPKDKVNATPRENVVKSHKFIEDDLYD